jgi:nitrile hydratase subunit beta
MIAAAKFRHGQSVRVRPEEHPGHHRTPWYVKGKIGRVDAVYDPWPNPEEMAYGKTDGPRISVYRVEFDQTELWESYSGPERDRLVVDIFEHWLEPGVEAS